MSLVKRAPEVCFLSTGPVFKNRGLIKFDIFSAFLALPAMVREGHGQIACQTLPNTMLSKGYASCGHASFGFSMTAH